MPRAAEPPKSMGDLLREARLSKGLALDDLAQRVALPSAMLAEYEEGKDLPTDAALKGLAGALGVSLVQLIAARFQTARASRGS